MPLASPWSPGDADYELDNCQGKKRFGKQHMSWMNQITFTFYTPNYGSFKWDWLRWS